MPRCVAGPDSVQKNVSPRQLTHERWDMRHSDRYMAKRRKKNSAKDHRWMPEKL